MKTRSLFTFTVLFFSAFMSSAAIDFESLKEDFVKAQKISLEKARQELSNIMFQGQCINSGKKGRLESSMLLMRDDTSIFPWDDEIKMNVIEWGGYHFGSEFSLENGPDGDLEIRLGQDSLAKIRQFGSALLIIWPHKHSVRICFYVD